jgi:hypothetical protein
MVRSLLLGLHHLGMECNHGLYENILAALDLTVSYYVFCFEQFGGEDSRAIGYGVAPLTQITFHSPAINHRSSIFFFH